MGAGKLQFVPEREGEMFEKRMSEAEVNAGNE